MSVVIASLEMGYYGLWCDSAADLGDMQYSCRDKIHRVGDRVGFGVVGSEPQYSRMVTSLLSLNLYDINTPIYRFEDYGAIAGSEESCAEGLVIHNGKLLYADTSGLLYEMCETFWAIGAGSGVAMGAMAAGSDPDEAVYITARYCPTVALPVRNVELDP